MTTGRIHSIETMGTVDGPGIRYVVFMQGCPLRCIFCHNRDAWDPAGGTETTVEELVSDVKNYIEFLKFSGGGITATGGEPTLQADFVCELFSEAKRLGLNTAMDTSGHVDIERAKVLLDQTDLVLLSIKHIDEVRHKDITGVSHDKIFKFMEYLREIGKPLWIRYVVIPNYTDDLGDVRSLAKFLKEFDNIELIDILPYHTMGIYKWEAMGIDYPLADVEAPGMEAVDSVKSIFAEYGFKVNIE